MFRLGPDGGPWGMVEVFMLGTLVSLAKPGTLPMWCQGPNCWSFGTLMFRSRGGRTPRSTSMNSGDASRPSAESRGVRAHGDGTGGGPRSTVITAADAGHA